MMSSLYTALSIPRLRASHSRGFAKMALDRIHVRGCVFHGYHGVYKGERELGQKFIVDLDIGVPLFTHAALFDGHLAATLDYGAVYRTMKPIVEVQRYQLLEQLSFQIMAELFESYALIEELTVTVKKPHVAVTGVVEYLGIEMRRDRSWWLRERDEWRKRITSKPKDSATDTVE